MERQFRCGNQLQRPFSVTAGVSCRGVSGPLQRAVTDLGADPAFRQVSMKLQEHYGITLAHETIRTITESHGRCVLEQTPLQSAWPAQAGKDCVVVEMDGGMVPVVLAESNAADRRKGKTLKWQELKLCIARGLDNAERFYGGTFLGDVKEAGQQLYHGACLAGFGRATQVHSVGDGATWIADQVEQQFGRQGAYLVDFYHLSEYLAEAAPHCADDAKAWLTQQPAALKANRSSGVLQALLPHIEPPSEPDDKAPVRKAYRYLRNRQDQVNYAGAIAKGRPIGSGEVESAHRFVVPARLKKPGAWWKPENVDPMLALRLARLNGRWDEYWQGAMAAGA